MAPLTLDWTEVAFLLGAVQGLLLTGVLLAQRTNRTANRLLAALMATMSVYLAGTVYYSADLVERFPHLFGISYPATWLFGPLVYLYAVAASDRSWRFTWRSLVHFVAPLIVVLSSAPDYLLSGVEKIAMYQRHVANDPPAMFVALAPTKYISGIGYSIATAMHLRGHRRSIEDNYSNTARVNLRWLGRLAGAAAAIWLIATLLAFANLGEHLREDYVSLGIALLIYMIGYSGLRQPEVFRYQTSEFAIPVPPSPAVEVPPADSDESPPSRYERSGLDDEEADQLRAALVALMDRERPWTDSELTLPDLATQLGTSPHKLSEVLNSRIGQTFYDFVNGYRVREVQRRIAAGEARRLKMLSLALDAGFASKSTFNEVFKKHTAQTPSGFQKQIGG